MARPWRVQFENAVYHIASRGNGRQNIFLDDHDRYNFLDLLGRASERFNLEIFSFCLMSNHYHLLLRTSKANLSPAMQWLNTTYAVRFKTRHHRSGHFFQGRFKSVLVEDEPHWQHLSFYIHLNPVRAGMVENPAQYKWSSYLDYIKSKSRFTWLCREKILSRFGMNQPKQRRSYRRKCLEMAKKPGEFWKDVRDAVIIGSTEFIGRIKKQFSPAGRKAEVTEYRRLARTEIGLEQELEKLSRVLKIEVSQFKFRSRTGKFPFRLLAYYHLVENCGMKQTEVADYFRVSIHAVSKGIIRLKAMTINNKTMQKFVRMSNVQV
jgi:putative transposase